MSDREIQWHPGFVAAMNLELRKNKNDLIFEKEYNLNTKPLEIDLLVIKKNRGVYIDNEIGQIFRGHNILEYKSPSDSLDIDVFYKTGAYASLYKSYGKTVDAIRADDITVTLFRETKPEGLFRYFEEHKYLVTFPYKGIYYIEGNVLFPTQIVVTKELNPEAHMWLRALSEKLQKQDMKRVLEAARTLTQKDDVEFADSVLRVSVEANQQVLDEMRGDDSMYEALLEIVKPEIDAKVNENNKVWEDKRRKSIVRTVVRYRRNGTSDTEIKKMLIEDFDLSAKEAEKYVYDLNSQLNN